MELKNLLTLSEFVHNQHTGTGLIKELAKMYIDCYKYNNFLKQPLIKEMFVNPFEQPNIPPQGKGRDWLGYYKLKEEWQEAEKKVIFEARYHNIQPSQTSNYYTIGGKVVATETNGGLCVHSLTFHNLAEATNGELTLKNVTI